MITSRTSAAPTPRRFNPVSGASSILRPRRSATRPRVEAGVDEESARRAACEPDEVVERAALFVRIAADEIVGCFARQRGVADGLDFVGFGRAHRFLPVPALV